jgi:phage-related protein
MPGIGPGCHELRIVDKQASWRVIYCIADDEIVVLDVFAKTTEQTPQIVIDACKSRLKAYRESR